MAGVLTLYKWLAQGTSDGFYNGNVQFGTQDTANVSSGAMPIGRPDAGATAFSMETYLSLVVTNPPTNQITNIRFWGNPNIPDSGVYMYVGTSVATATPVITHSGKAIHHSTAYPDASNYLQWSEKSLATNGDWSDYLVMQIHILSGALIGDHAGENMVFHYSYDES